MSTGPKFTKEEDLLLRVMFAAGATDMQIAAALGRSQSGVQSRRYKLRLKSEFSNARPYHIPVEVGEDALCRANRMHLDLLRGAHPGGYQDGPVKQVRRVHYVRQDSGQSLIGSSAAMCAI